MRRDDEEQELVDMILVLVAAVTVIYFVSLSFPAHAY
jgi:hypothetical protein